MPLTVGDTAHLMVTSIIPTGITGEASKGNQPKGEMHTVESRRHPNTGLQSSSLQEAWTVLARWSQWVTISAEYCQLEKSIEFRVQSCY